MTTEPVRDRKEHNYCEEFVPSDGKDPGGSSGHGATEDDFSSLFGKGD